MPDSANLYIYARNNPIRYQDPDGHDQEENEFAILREMGLTEYLKRSYKMIWDELSYSNEHFATFGTFDMLTYAFSGLGYGILKANGADINYLEVGAVFKDTSNTAQAAPKAEKAVAESGEEVLEQAEKAAGKAVEESGEEILEQTGKAIESGKKTIKSTFGNEIDVTPSSKHTSVNKNPGPYGEANTSVDILDAEGNIKTRRWYDSDGKAYRDVDMSDHGNPKEHPEVPHEHTWEYNNGKPKRN